MKQTGTSRFFGVWKLLISITWIPIGSVWLNEEVEGVAIVMSWVKGHGAGSGWAEMTSCPDIIPLVFWSMLFSNGRRSAAHLSLDYLTPQNIFFSHVEVGAPPSADV